MKISRFLLKYNSWYWKFDQLYCSDMCPPFGPRKWVLDGTWGGIHDWTCAQIHPQPCYLTYTKLLGFAKLEWLVCYHDFRRRELKKHQVGGIPLLWYLSRGHCKNLLFLFVPLTLDMWLFAYNFCVTHQFHMKFEIDVHVLV